MSLDVSLSMVKEKATLGGEKGRCEGSRKTEEKACRSMAWPANMVSMGCAFLLELVFSQTIVVFRIEKDLTSLRVLVK